MKREALWLSPSSEISRQISPLWRQTKLAWLLRALSTCVHWYLHHCLAPGAIQILRDAQHMYIPKECDMCREQKASKRLKIKMMVSQIKIVNVTVTIKGREHNTVNSYLLPLDFFFLSPSADLAEPLMCAGAEAGAISVFSSRVTGLSSVFVAAGTIRVFLKLSPWALGFTPRPFWQPLKGTNPRLPSNLWHCTPPNIPHQFKPTQILFTISEQLN